MTESQAYKRRSRLRRLRCLTHRLLSLACAVGGVTGIVLLLIETEPLRGIPHGFAGLLGIMGWRDFATRADEEGK